MAALTRRRLLAGTAALCVLAPARTLAQASAALSRGLANGLEFGLVPGGEADQGPALQAAAEQAAALGLPLFLPGGRYRISGARLPAGAMITGAGPQTLLVGMSDGPILHAAGADHIALSHFAVDGGGAGPSGDRAGLLAFTDCAGLDLDALTLSGAPGNGLYLERASGRVSGSSISRCGHSALFARGSTGLLVTANAIADCDNAGIRIWRESAGPDGTIVTANRIGQIGWNGGGNGQNGNGINVFNADGVIVADNHIADCAFTAIRLNATANAQVRGNTCLQSGEVAIFSEFGFSGSLIAGNIVDGAALGISMTNFDSEGRLAVCSGNLVRNITPTSPVNPDTRPAGIFAEADAALTGNVVEAVPGPGILAGWGPYLRDVLVADNLVRDCAIGIAASVAPGAGTARIAGNLVTASTRHALAGMAWTEIETPDLTADPARHPHLSVADNTVG